MKTFLIILLLIPVISTAQIVSPTNYEVISILGEEIEVSLLNPFKNEEKVKVIINDSKDNLIYEKEIQSESSNTIKISLNEQLRVRRKEWLTLYLFKDDKLVDSKKFGLGLIFLTAGQSNSTNSHKVMLDRTISNLVSAKKSENEFIKLERSEMGDIVPNVEDLFLSDFKNRSSIWPYLGDKLVETYNVPIAFVNIGYSGSAIERWNSNTSTNDKLTTGLRQRLEFAKGHKYNGVLWHQGEANSKIPSDENIDVPRAQKYHDELLKLIEESRVLLNQEDLVWFVSITSRICKWEGEDDSIKHDPYIAQAQKDIIENGPNVLAGPNTNLIEHECHFDTRDSLSNFVDTWFDQLIFSGEFALLGSF